METPEWQIRYEMVLLGEQLEECMKLVDKEAAGGTLTTSEVRAKTAFFEAHLLHVRNVVEFLTTYPNKKGRFAPATWAPGWDPKPIQKQFKGLEARLNIELAHLSDQRRGAQPWRTIPEADPVIRAFEMFVSAITVGGEHVHLLGEGADLARASWNRASTPSIVSRLANTTASGEFRPIPPTPGPSL